ncbi:16S rRNA (cytosine967-C5)-methyltransferase [Clostridium tetanomorphum]|uniref:16S rRNA (cytosine(967)-C(5))-methyltransferase n=1 Tax=Clostridium tetanomorphum TaxID=1553 RepID=A0A923J1J3_CLOTT|nr:16S rRNA (cytosine(967)-C(5))-methyltransferase RsmB [Clostridium tetanomorphum]KAJ51507.1 16S rRNA methyltransferase B [Clostridium tetanomorphum DSM 665]MBC2398859.1 16S rRNA (cytosine(967)-C(5))-methyltransferase RsmB [Clostridium tetanomorphum]MBP1865155.1 16S rRNA (cytosine967-C5)-methyltransferase [Clostridium tetanomorphum]NRS84706.1 16S rRNA (cytosine967-C5)-methyltransferase [Clostridium tetanomorphum]NRZ97921.1 16S rRNA (cytosine967-C5)-methyltransferase [Clostridium tetanomorphum
MENSRKIALDILEEILNKNAYSNIVINNKLNKSKLSDKDKALVTEIVYGTLKYKYTIDTILNYHLKNGIKNLDSYVLNVLRIGIYQIRYLDKIPSFAAVNECVELGKKKSKGMSKLINGVLRNYLRSINRDYCGEKTLDKLSFNYSFPKWLVKLFINQYGEERGESILKGLNSVPTVTVRINSLKGSYEYIWQRLVSNNYNIEEGIVCPEGIKIIKGRNIENNPLFKEGYITVQDESAMLVAPAMDLKDNMIVLDLCSAPGGKTTHISEIMNNTGKVLAFDIHENKLSLIKENIDRLGINNISLNTMDATIYNSSLNKTGDRVLIDVPCSGLGIIRKKPEIKYTKDKKSLNSLIEIQRKILINAARYVKDNGIILYSTCTLNKDENEENIKWFIDKFPQFKVEPIFYGNLQNLIYSELGTLTILPNESMDGFFIAKLRKQG